MIIYTCSLLWVLLICSIGRYEKVALGDGSVERHATKATALCAMAYFVFFIGLRSAGADTHAYIHSYDQYEPGIRNIMDAFSYEEGLFEAFGIAVKTFISDSYYPYLFLIALISGVALVNTLRKYTPYFKTAMILFVLEGTWSWMINGIRQFLAVTLAFSALGLILRRKWLLYCTIVFVLTRIHSSAIILIPVYFLVQGRAFAPKTLLMIALAIFAIVFTGSFTDVMDDALSLTAYSDMTTNTYFLENDGSNPIRTLIFAVPVVLALMDKENIQKNAPPVIHLCVNMSIICVCVSAIANVTSGIYVGRLPIYFSVYNLILLPWLVHNTHVMDANTMTGLMYAFYGAYYIYANYIQGRGYYQSDLLGLFIR